MRRIGRASVGLQSALCLASSARVENRVGSTIDLRSHQMHTRPRGCPIGSARRASERGATCTRQVSPSPMGISSCRGIDRVVARVPGQSCHSDGFGPTGGSWVGEGGAGKCGAFRVWRRWDERGRARTVGLGAVLAGVGPTDCHAAQRKWSCSLQSQEAKGFLARPSR